MSNIHRVVYRMNSPNVLTAIDTSNSSLIKNFSINDIMEFMIESTKVFFYIQHMYSIQACNSVLLVGLLWDNREWKKEVQLQLNSDITWEQISFDPVQLPWIAQTELNKIVQIRTIVPDRYINEDEEYKQKFTEFKTPLEINLDKCSMKYNKNELIMIQTSTRIEYFKLMHFIISETYTKITGTFYDPVKKIDTSTLEHLFMDTTNNKGMIRYKDRPLGTILPNTIKCKEMNKLIYDGNEKDEIMYMKEAFKSLQSLNPELVAKIQKGEKINNKTLKINNQCVLSIPMTDVGNRSLDLYKQASEKNIGPKIVDYYYVVNKQNIPTRQYLITEYLKPVPYHPNDPEIKSLAEKIAKSTIKIHPFFRSNMIGKNESDVLKVMFWDISEMYKFISSKDMNTYESRKNFMLKKYKEVIPFGGKKTKQKRKRKSKTIKH